MRSKRYYLSVDFRGDAKVTKTKPSPTVGVAVIELNLRLPTPPAIAAVLDVELPEAPEAMVSAMVAAWEQVRDADLDGSQHDRDD